MIFRLEELFPDQLQARLEACPILVLPIGTIEWHSYHLPLGLDGLVAQAIGAEVAQKTGGVLSPVTYWAVGGVPYPFTLNLSSEQIEPLLVAAFEQFGAMGFRVIVAFTGHFGLDHTLSLKQAALTVMQRSPVTILPLTEYDLVTDVYQGDHAGIGETSLLWALRPDLVRLDHLPADQPLDGVIGADPRGQASTEKGQVLLQTIATRIGEVALRLLQQTSPLQRSDFVEAIRAGVAVLAKTSQQRRVLPKKEVPPITTSAYLTHCQALYAGDYRAAKASAEQKLANLAH